MNLIMVINVLHQRKGPIMIFENSNVTRVADVIKVLQVGVEFYVDVIDAADDHDIKRVFIRMIKERELAIDELQTFAPTLQGEDEPGGSLPVSVQRLYTHLLGKLCFDKEHTFITQLKKVENKTLLIIDWALLQHQPRASEQCLRRIRVAMQSCQDDMTVLKLISVEII